MTVHDGPEYAICTDLRVRFGCGSDRQPHRRRRNSSRIADAALNRPASADFHEAVSASCNARRSSVCEVVAPIVSHEVDNRSVGNAEVSLIG